MNLPENKKKIHEEHQTFLKQYKELLIYLKTYSTSDNLGNVIKDLILLMIRKCATYSRKIQEK